MIQLVKVSMSMYNHRNDEILGKNYIFQNVNINSINFVNNKNDIKFDFIDSLYNSGKPCRELLCVDVKSLTMSTDLDDDPFFPQFICDVSIEKASVDNNSFSVVFEGGSYYISLTCTEVKC